MLHMPEREWLDLMVSSPGARGCMRTGQDVPVMLEPLMSSHLCLIFGEA